MSMALLSTPELGANTLTPREYQSAAIDAARVELGRHRKRSTLIILPTGTGKTVAFALAARSCVEKGGRALVIAHREELITQAANVIERAGLHPAVERADSYARAHFEPNVVVASVQTIGGKKRLATWPRDYFNLIVIDEAHHATAETYRRVANHFASAKLLGVTATPDRADDDEIAAVFESVAYEMSIWEAMTAPAPGPYLCPLKIVRCEEPIDLRGIRTTAGDFNAAELEERIGPIIESLANAIKPRIEGRQSIVFTPDCGSSSAMATALQSIGVRADYVWGDSPDRAEKVAKYQAGETQVLVNCLDSETEILTSRGWVGMEDFRDTDITATFNPATEAIEWEPVSRVVRRPRATDERMVHVKNQTLDIRVTEGHRMVVRTRGAKAWQVVEAGTLPDRVCSYQIPLAGHDEPDWDVYHPDGTTPPHRLDADQCKFIGLWIADGTIDRNGSRGVSISQSGRYVEANEEIRSLLDSCGFDWSRRDYAVAATAPIASHHLQHRYRVPKGNIGGRLARRGYAGIEAYLDKDLSGLLDGLDRVQFRALVEGLWLGDGLKFKGRRLRNGIRSGWAIVSSNKTMLDRLQAMAVCRGFAANISRPRDNGPMATKPVYTICIRDRHAVATNNVSVPTSGGNHARFEEGWKPETVWCVTNATGTIITRRNGRVAITGQCMLFTEGFDAPSTSAIVLCRPTKSRSLYSQMVGRGTRLAPGKPDCLLIDFAWLTDKMDLVRPSDLFDRSNRPDDEAKILAEVIEKATGPIDLIEAAERAKDEAVRRREIAVKARAKSCNMRFVIYNALDMANTLGIPVRGATRDAIHSPATDRQVETLAKFGVADAATMSVRRATKMLETIFDRRSKNLATPKQLTWLVKLGVEPNQARSMTFAEASAFLDSKFQKRA